MELRIPKTKSKCYRYHRLLWKNIKKWYESHPIKEWEELDVVKSYVIDDIVGCDVILSDCFLCHWYKTMDSEPNPINSCFKCPCARPSKLKCYEDRCYCMPYSYMVDLLEDDIIGFNPENDEVKASIRKFFELMDKMINIKEA